MLGCLSQETVQPMQAWRADDDNDVLSQKQVTYSHDIEPDES